MTHPCGYIMHFFEKRTRTHTHTFKNNRATGPKRVRLLLFQFTHLHLFLHSSFFFSFFFGADKKGAFLKEACRGPHIKRRCCSALQRIAAYCNVLQCVVTHPHASLHSSLFLFVGRRYGGHLPERDVQGTSYQSRGLQSVAVCCSVAHRIARIDRISKEPYSP